MSINPEFYVKNEKCLFMPVWTKFIKLSVFEWNVTLHNQHFTIYVEY